MKQPVLVIEDDTTLCQLLARQLSKVGFATTGVSTWSAAQSYLARTEPALVITDVRLPEGDMLDHLLELAENYPVIVLTAFGSVRNAVEAMKKGAADYLLKPVSLDELLRSHKKSSCSARHRTIPMWRAEHSRIAISINFVGMDHHEIGPYGGDEIGFLVAAVGICHLYPAVHLGDLRAMHTTNWLERHTSTRSPQTSNQGHAGMLL